MPNWKIIFEIYGVQVYSKSNLEMVSNMEFQRQITACEEIWSQPNIIGLPPYGIWLFRRWRNSSTDWPFLITNKNNSVKPIYKANCSVYEWVCLIADSQSKKTLTIAKISRNRFTMFYSDVNDFHYYCVSVTSYICTKMMTETKIARKTTFLWNYH